MSSELSKTRVNRAGERLAAAHDDGITLPPDECDVVVRWREMHAVPLVWTTLAMQRRLSLGASYRLKRLPQIITKLARAGSMNLARMQDIGGCRVILETLSDLSQARADIESRTRPHYEVVRVVDYCNDGRDVTGYRAMHMIVRRQEMEIEVQLRTRLQHAWAEAVERAANRTGFALKDGEGPPRVVEFFRLASECLAKLDRGERVSAAERKELGRLDAELDEYLRDRPKKESPEQRIRDKRFSTVSNNWLLIYNWQVGKLEYWVDCKTNAKRAARMYSEYERRYSWDQGYEVVLIGSDSKETIEWTHAHYFGRSADDLDPHGVFRRLLAA